MSCFATFWQFFTMVEENFEILELSPDWVVLLLSDNYNCTMVEENFEILKLSPDWVGLLLSDNSSQWLKKILKF